MSETAELLPARPCSRIAALEDIHIREDGTGRIVEAYAAAFGVRSEVMDSDGHYEEELARTSFDRTIKHKGPGGFSVLFNHGRTIDGTPAGELTMPIGVPLEVKRDDTGVYTATRYLQNPLADGVLEGIIAGAIKAQSFSGRFTKSVRSYPNGRARSALPLITRQEVDMREYGPAVFAAYPDAKILGTRAEWFMRTLLETPPERRVAFLEQFEGLTTPEGDPEALTPDTPDPGPVEADDPREPVSAHSARSIPLRSRIRAARITRGWDVEAGRRAADPDGSDPVRHRRA